VRVAGRTKFNMPALVRLSIDGICNQSTLPLQYITMFGFFTSLFSALLIVVYLADYFLNERSAPQGFTTLVLLTLTSMSVQSLFIGLIGEYIGRIYNNVRGGPPTIIADRIESRIESSASTDGLPDTQGMLKTNSG
jgi:dolichol-phosphate mannosyltransferase